MTRLERATRDTFKSLGVEIVFRPDPSAKPRWYGNLKRYSYDPCAFTNPPPYFPTTGHFARARLFDVDASNFSAATLFDNLTPD